MRKLKLIFLSSHEKNKELAKAYWERNGEGKYTYTVAELADKFGLKKGELCQIVKQSSGIIDEDYKCENCGSPLERLFSTRTELTYTPQKQRDHFCPECEEKQREKGERQKKEELALKTERKEKELALKRKRMREAYEKGVYEQLSPVEFNFLVALASSGSSGKAGEKIGLKEATADKIYMKLDQLDLIWHDPEAGKYYFLNDSFKEALIRIGQKRKVKSIFGSPKERELYLKLKRKHLFVYPQQPLSSFVDMAAVEHLFDKEWHRGYFLTCRVDCVVCEQDGTPIFVAEYQGGGHESEWHRERDSFKKKVLGAVGLNLMEINSKELTNEGE